MAVSTAIYNIIRANANCVTAFGTRIYPMEIPEQEKIPAVTYRVNSITPEFTMGPDRSQQWDEVALTVTVFADTYTLCETYAGYLRTAFTHYVGTTGSTNVRESRCDGLSDGDIFQKGQGESSSTGIGIFTKELQITIITTA